MNQHSQSSRQLLRAASICLATLVLATGLLSTARAAVVLSHSGDADPAAEGWTLVSKKPDLHSGEAVDDGGTPAWKIQDSEVVSSGAGSWYYRGDVALTSQNIDDLLTQGWAMRANLRVDDSAASGYDETPGLTPGIQIAFETEHTREREMPRPGHGFSSVLDWTKPAIRPIRSRAAIR